MPKTVVVHCWVPTTLCEQWVSAQSVLMRLMNEGVMSAAMIAPPSHGSTLSFLAAL